jgi:hypothetical protein
VEEGAEEGGRLMRRGAAAGLSGRGEGSGGGDGEDEAKRAVLRGVEA